MDADLAALESLAGQVRRSLHWAAFLLLMMGVILVIDLQLKKSIARQAVRAATWLGQVQYGGPAPDTPTADTAGSGRGDDVGGDAGMAAPDGTGPHPGAGAQDGGVDGAQVRSPGHERRTRRAPGSG